MIIQNTPKKYLLYGKKHPIILPKWHVINRVAVMCIHHEKESIIMIRQKNEICWIANFQFTKCMSIEQVLLVKRINTSSQWSVWLTYASCISARAWTSAKYVCGFFTTWLGVHNCTYHRLPIYVTQMAFFQYVMTLFKYSKTLKLWIGMYVLYIYLFTFSDRWFTLVSPIAIRHMWNTSFENGYKIEC